MTTASRSTSNGSAVSTTSMLTDSGPQSPFDPSRELPSLRPLLLILLGTAISLSTVVAALWP